MSPGGRGKMLLGERRVPKEEVLDTLSGMLAEAFPDYRQLKVGEGCFPSVEEAVMSSSGRRIILVYGPRFYSGKEEYIASLPDDVVVICTQELCHQVSSAFRMH